MKLDAPTLAPPLAAMLILVLVVTLTREALQLSGAWQKASAAAAAAPSPFATLESEIASSDPVLTPISRDPFRLGPAPVAAVTGPRRPMQPVRPAPPPVPVLTSIIFDADPRATVRWDGRDYSVRPGGLFADFRVTSITRDQVVLDHGGESVVLRLPRRGEH
jgi:hypothetical protein